MSVAPTCCSRAYAGEVEPVLGSGTSPDEGRCFCLDAALAIRV